LKFSVPWWNFTKEQGNRAVPIIYGSVENGKAGATGLTDTKLVQVAIFLFHIYFKEHYMFKGYENGNKS
jgi:hypothetical protein